MKRILCIMVALLFLFSCTKKEYASPVQPSTKDKIIIDNKEFRAVWISCFDLQEFDFSTETAFVECVRSKFKNIKNIGLNTVIVQVRPFADAIYKSDIFPWSKYVYENEPQFDPFLIMTEIAEDFDLSIHAWINPYRISSDNSIEKLDMHSPALEFLNKNTSDIVIVENGIYFNPASLAAQKIVIDGIKEILNNYKIDAIHIDDYFYPTTEKSFDYIDYEKYQKSGGELSLADWRRENVNSLVSAIYSTIKNYDPGILFGISPGGNIEYNYKNLYADVKKWCKNPGYADYIIPQIYFGFDNTSKPFCETVNEWTELAKGSDIDIFCGLALYKCGTVDEFCSNEKAKYEWQMNNDIIKRQVLFVRKNYIFRGFALFSLRNLSKFPNKNSKIEMQNLRSVL